MDKVSVVITTYKRKFEFKKAFESVIKQSYKNIEIIVVDDNVDEVYTNFVKQILSTYRNIIYIKNKKNMGGALSRNVGLNVASGKYIAFLDDDDVYFEKKNRKTDRMF